jgi:hypothetical protein
LTELHARNTAARTPSLLGSESILIAKFSINHDSHNGENPNGVTPNGTSYGPNNVPGQILENNYHSWGDTVNLREALSFGDLKAGAWFSLPWDWRPHRSKRVRFEFRAAIAYIRSGSAAIVIFPTK